MPHYRCFRNKTYIAEIQAITALEMGLSQNNPNRQFASFIELGV
jgi:hypothetical protein